MNNERILAASAATLGAVFALASANALAAKPGGGGTQDPCATVTDFPSFIYGVTTASRKSGNSVEMRVADSTGRCSRSLVKGIPGSERRPLLMNLGSGNWRAVWPDGDSVSAANDGVVVQDFTVGSGAVVTPGASGRIGTGPARELEAMGDGGFVYLKTSSTYAGTADALYRVTVSANGPSALTLTATELGDVRACDMTLIAVGPDGDSLYFATFRPDGTLGTIVKKASFSTLTADLQTCGTQVKDVGGGGTQQLAAGLCGPNTCIALERHNVRNDPCVSDYYRTDVFALDAAQSSVTLQIAFPSWGSEGELLGRRTGSTSNNACTAKIYEELVRYRLGNDLSAGSAVAIGTGRTLDAPNPVNDPPQ